MSERMRSHPALGDKERFGQDEAEEKLKHMGEKTEQSPKPDESKTGKG